MKKILPLLLVAVGSFLAVWWLNRDVGDDDQDRVVHSTESDERLEYRKDDPRLRAPQGARRAAPSEELVVDLEGEEEALERGQLEIKARVGVSVPPELVVNLRLKSEPTLDLSGRRERSAESVLYRELAPGLYDVWLYGGEIVPVLYRDVRIDAGKRRSLSFQLERGLLFQGRVVTAYPPRPVPFARVDFSGRATVDCDADGNFALTQRLSRAALETITVSAEGWDTQTYRHLSIPDPECMELPLGYGDREVLIDVINRTTSEIPREWQVLVTIAPLFHPRRSVNLKNGETQVTIDNLYASDHYRFELHFPGGEFPVQKKRVPLEKGDARTTIPFVIEEGAALDVVCQGPDILKQSGEMQLRDIRGETMARCRIKDDGSFRFRHVEPGRYTAMLITAGGHKTLGPVQLAPNERATYRLDLLRNKLSPE